MTPQQVFDWRRQDPRATAAIEVTLAGAVLRVTPGTDADLLTAVLRAIRGSAA